MAVKRSAAEKEAGGRSRARFGVQAPPDFPLVKRPTYARSYECKCIPGHDDIAYQHFGDLLPLPSLFPLQPIVPIVIVHGNMI